MSKSISDQAGARYEYDVFAAVIIFVAIVVYLRKKPRSQLTKPAAAPPQPHMHPRATAPTAAAEAGRPIAEVQTSAEQMLPCPSCGALNRATNQFCGKCGGSLQRFAFCEECGRKIPAGAVYCRYCGDKQGA